jgi:FAD/FMN-containing dehydrogenase
LQIDLSSFRYCHVDPASRTATVAGGSLLGELDHEAMAHGLVTTAGTVSHTGVGGLTLGGGFGRLARRFGLSIDNVLAFDIVTPDCKLMRASADQNPDLYWALRGGGGNFGVVTAFVFQLHPMQREVVSGRFTFPMKEAKQVMNFFGEYAEAAPDEMHVGTSLGASPGMPEPVAGIYFVWSGDPKDVEKLVAPIRKAGNPTEEKIDTWDYVSLQRSGDNDDPRANGSYARTGFVGAFSPGLVDAIVDNFEMAPDRATWLGTQQSGGAIGRVPNDATAFAHREASHNLLSFVGWKHGTDPTDHVAYIKRHWENVAPFTRGFYTNDVFDETQEEINANYRGNYARLLEVKRTYDPENLLRLNANIKPA